MEKVLVLKDGQLVEMTKERMNKLKVDSIRGFVNKVLKHYIIEAEGSVYEYYYNF